jgi:sortase A
MFWTRLKTLSSPQKKGLSLILFGCLLLLSAISFQVYQFFQQNRLAFSQPPQLTTEIKEEELPQRIVIDKIKLDLAVFPAQISDGHWETSKEGASYLLGSGLPGKNGNVIIYGHNQNYLFGPIRWLNAGEDVKLINKKGEEYIYSIIQTKTVKPEAIEILAPTEEPILTLYTCTGFFDRERFVVIAQLKSD